jgi:hypothetical protein
MEPKGSWPSSQEPPLISVLRQMNPVHNLLLPIYFPKINFNNIKHDKLYKYTYIWY